MSCTGSNGSVVLENAESIAVAVLEISIIAEDGWVVSGGSLI